MTANPIHHCWVAPKVRRGITGLSDTASLTLENPFRAHSQSFQPRAKCSVKVVSRETRLDGNLGKGEIQLSFISRTSEVNPSNPSISGLPAGTSPGASKRSLRGMDNRAVSALANSALTSSGFTFLCSRSFISRHGAWSQPARHSSVARL